METLHLCRKTPPSKKSNLATTILFYSSSCDSSNRPPKTSLQSKIFKGCPKKA
jgi:hypothetical protein